MNSKTKKIHFPFTNTILILSLVLLLFPLFSINLVVNSIDETNIKLVRLLFLLSTLLPASGFIYCTIGFHYKIVSGDELKFRIHLEALNIAFTTTLVFLFALIFIFINFQPTLLNYLILIVAIIAIVAYVIGVEIVKRKYR